MTRATIIWFVGAAVVGAIAGGLHLLRSDLGGAHTGLPLLVSAFALTLLAAAMLFHGVMVAAREQDAAAGPAIEPVDGPDGPDERDDRDDRDERTEGAGVEPVADRTGRSSGVPERVRATDGDDAPARPEAPEVYTFRAGKPVGDRTQRPARRDQSSQS